MAHHPLRVTRSPGHPPPPDVLGTCSLPLLFLRTSLTQLQTIGLGCFRRFVEVSLDSATGPVQQIVQVAPNTKHQPRITILRPIHGHFVFLGPTAKRQQK